MNRNLILSLIVGLAVTAPIGGPIYSAACEQTEAAQAFRGEELALSVTKTYECGLIGFSTDDTYSVPGKVVRVEIIASKAGPLSADAYEGPRTPGQVSVHRYCDAFTKLTYTLKVYVEK